jgi:hypothetical protein
LAGDQKSRTTCVGKGVSRIDKNEKTKEERIKSELSKFKKICKDLEKNKKNIALKLSAKAAFMEVTLQDLEAQINEQGAIVKGKNGNGFEVVAENPATKTYNTMIKNYNATIKTLMDIMPDSTGVVDELAMFVRGKK